MFEALRTLHMGKQAGMGRLDSVEQRITTALSSLTPHEQGLTPTRTLAVALQASR